MFARKFKKARRVAQRGMTLLEIMIVLAILALVMGLVVGPRVMKMFGESKVDIAKMTVNKYANEAYPSWASSHSDACPKQLTDLNEYMNNKDIKDPWGNVYQYLQPGVHGDFVVVLQSGKRLPLSRGCRERLEEALGTA